MYRAITCSQNASSTAIRDTIKRKITSLKAGESLSEIEFVDMIEFHQENTGLQQQQDKPGLYFEKYSLIELQETEGKRIHTAIEIECIHVYLKDFRAGKACASVPIKLGLCLERIRRN